MYTRCPNCFTLYRIQAEQLKAAAGMARCCCCSKVFNALENLSQYPGKEREEAPPSGTQADSKSAPPPSDTQPEPNPSREKEDHNLANWGWDEEMESILLTEEEIEADFALNGIEEDTEPLSGEMTNEPLAPPIEALPAEPDAELTDVPAESAGPETEEAPPPIEIPEGLTDIEPTQCDTLSLEELLETPKKKRPATLAWTFGTGLLLLLLGGQFAWFERTALIQYPMGRLLLEKACTVAGCRVPVRRDLEQIQVLDREITAHATIDRALLVRLVLVNGAPFDQPYPQLQLSLFTADQHLTARRRFNPAEYLGTAGDRDGLMPAGQPQRVELLLEDPGKRVTGFRFDFY